MDYNPNVTSRLLQIFYLFALLLIAGISCQKEDGNISDLELIPQFHPDEIAQFDHIDSLFYSYLGIDSHAFDDGSFILPIWDPPTLIKTNFEATEIISTTGRGKGPGEMLDIGRPAFGNGLIYVFDQFQQKIVILDQNDLSLVKEIIPEPYREYRIYRTYPALQDGLLPVEVGSAQLEIDKMDQKILVTFDPEDEEFGTPVQLKGKPHAPLGEVINERSGSARMVPFSNDQFVVPVPENGTLLFYDTRTDTIAEVNSAFDTLDTIPVELPTEALSDIEKDSIKVDLELSDSDWQSVESRMPEIKAPADNMLYHHNEIWLKSNLRGEHDIWLAINFDGEILYSVYLPRNSRLMHVSDQHLGVRLDDVSFGLFEKPNTRSEN